MPPGVIEFLSQANSPFDAIGIIVRNGGLVPFFPLLVWMCWKGWHRWVMNKFGAARSFVMMAIDVPKTNEQSMKAVEHIISALHGIQFGPSFFEKYWLGLTGDSFALEIVSIDGYIQYFIRCDSYNVQLVKGAIFAQFPDAEIVEVEDYVQNVPQEYPNETHDLWGSEFVLLKDASFPIRTYEHFEHSLTGIYADPAAALLELMSRLSPGEQIWLQFIVTPSGSDSYDAGLKTVNDLIGKKVPGTVTNVDKALYAPIQGLGMIGDAVFGAGEREGLGADEGSEGNFLNMTSGEKLVVEEVQKKISRLAFETKIRLIYVGRKEVFGGWRVAGSMLGALKQFSTRDMNALVPGGHTLVGGVQYLFPTPRNNARKNKMMIGYRKRSNLWGEKRYALSDVELATLWHFPTENVRAPLVTATESKKSEPPRQLPFEGRVAPIVAPSGEELPAEPPADGPGVELPGADVPGVVIEGGAPPAGLPVDAASGPLHSMEGLPPGVKAVEGGFRTSEAAATTVGAGSRPMSAGYPAPPQRPQESGSPEPPPLPEQQAWTLPAYRPGGMQVGQLMAAQGMDEQQQVVRPNQGVQQVQPQTVVARETPVQQPGVTQSVQQHPQLAPQQAVPAQPQLQQSAQEEPVKKGAPPPNLPI